MLRIRSGLIFTVMMLFISWQPPAHPQATTMNADHYGGMIHPSAAGPSFEVAVIRQSSPGAERRFSGLVMHPDKLQAFGTSIKDLIEFAYAVPNENQLIGGPSWIRSELFDITAKPSEAETSAMRKLSNTNQHLRMRLLLQSLLVQRFGLQVGFTQKTMPLFALELGKTGLRCTKVAPDTASWFDNPEGAPPPSGPAEGQLQQGPNGASEMHWEAHPLPFPLILAWLSQQPELNGRTILDKTGLNGVFDCTVAWAREDTDQNGPSLFTAIRDQMGLKLIPGRGPVETIVIDRIKPPTDN